MFDSTHGDGVDWASSLDPSLELGSGTVAWLLCSSLSATSLDLSELQASHISLLGSSVLP